jgi:O-antigen/teichoic acid export membrane protein
MLSAWGENLYGEWLTITGLVASLSILNLGVQSYTCNLLIAHHVHGEIEAGTRLLHAALRLYLILSGIALLLLCGFLLWPGVLDWLNVNQITPQDARTIILIYGLLAIYAIFGGLLLSLFQVIKRMPRQLTYALLERLLFFVVPMFVVLLGGQPVDVATAFGLATVGLIAIELRDARRSSPFSIGVTNTSWRVARGLIRPSLLFFGASFAGVLLSAGIISLIANGAGGSAVAIFSTTLLLTNFVRIMINQGMNVMWPEITGAAATADDPRRLARWHRLLLKLATGLALICAGGIVLLGSDVLSAWTRGQITVDPVLNVLLAVYLVIHVPGIVSGAFGFALNRQSRLLRVQIATALITLFLAALLIPNGGVAGAAIALAAGQVVGSSWMLHSASEWTGDRRRTLLSDWGVRSVPTLLATAALLVIAASLQPELAGRAAIALLVVIVGSLLIWTTWLQQSERLLLTRQLKSIFQRHAAVDTQESLI